MKLKLLIVAIPLLLPVVGCTVHFPLEDNSPTLSSADDSPSTAGTLSAAPTAPDTHDPIKGNTADTPDMPR
jgi:hypothetical protein